MLEHDFPSHGHDSLMLSHVCVCTCHSASSTRMTCSGRSTASACWPTSTCPPPHPGRSCPCPSTPLPGRRSLHRSQRSCRQPLTASPCLLTARSVGEGGTFTQRLELQRPNRQHPNRQHRNLRQPRLRWSTLDPSMRYEDEPWGWLMAVLSPSGANGQMTIRSKSSDVLPFAVPLPEGWQLYAAPSLPYAMNPKPPPGAVSMKQRKGRSDGAYLIHS